MPFDDNTDDYSARLRKKAGELLKSKVQTKHSSFSEDDVLKIIHELEMAWIEIDKQNEEIRQAKAEASQRINEEVFRQFLENSPIYVFFKDENIRSLNLSRNYEEMLGKPLHELLGKTMDELFPSDLAREMVANDLEILKEGKKVTVEEELNGRNYSTIKFPINLDGKKPLLAGFTIDITESKKAQFALTKSEEKYRKLHQSLRDGFVYVSMEGAIIESNKAYQDMLGYSPEELAVLSYIDITPEKWHEPENEIVAKHILPHGFSPVYEKEYRKKDGTIFPVELRTFLITDDNNQPQGMWAIARDISERKMVMEALRASEEKFKSIVESSPSAMYFYQLQNDNRLVLTGTNPAADQIIGISHQSLLGKTLEEAFPKLAGTDIPEMYKDIARGILPHQAFEIEYQDNQISGIYDVRVFKTGLNMIAVDFTDISYRKKTEEILRQNEANLRELNATKDKFFSIIAHDLKSPFTAIIGFSSLLKNQVKVKNFQNIETFADNILQSSERVMELLKNLQDWSRAQTGRMAYNPEFLNLLSLVEEIIDLLFANSRQKSITIICEISPLAQVFADRPMINTVLRNFISNAIKFTNTGGEIIISAEENPMEIIVSVSDNGVGIPKEGIEKLFRIDQNYSTPGTNNEKGTGLGLILCKEFIDKHRGKTGVESTEGKGSRFYFSLPAAGYTGN